MSFLWVLIHIAAAFKTWKWIVNWPFFNNYSSSKQISLMGIMCLWQIIVWSLQLMQANLTHIITEHIHTPRDWTNDRAENTAADSVVCLLWLEMSRRLHFNKEILVQTGYIMVSELWDNTEVKPPNATQITHTILTQLFIFFYISVLCHIRQKLSFSTLFVCVYYAHLM